MKYFYCLFTFDSTSCLIHLASRRRVEPRKTDREKGRTTNSCSHSRPANLRLPQPRLRLGYNLQGAEDSADNSLPRLADWPRQATRHALLSQWAEDKSSRGCLRNRAASIQFPLAGQAYGAAPWGSPGSLSGRGASPRPFPL